MPGCGSCCCRAGRAAAPSRGCSCHAACRSAVHSAPQRCQQRPLRDMQGRALQLLHIATATLPLQHVASCYIALQQITLHCTGAVRALDETPEKCSGACAISSYFCHSSDVCCHFCHVTPQVVVNEMHQLVANPELQVQATDYAKQACGLVPSLADSCRADVDQYAPMLFGMVLAYLQPQQVRGCPSSLFTPVLPLCCCVGRAPAPAHIDDERVRTTPNHSRCDHDACVAPFCLHTCRYACS